MTTSRTHTAMVALGAATLSLVSCADSQDPVETSRSPITVTSVEGTLETARAGHNAVLLTDGRVLLAGGGSDTAQVFDIVHGSTTVTGTMKAARQYATAVMLLNTKVWVAGGHTGGTSLASTELFDPETLSWSAGPALPVARDSHTATVLANGKVLLVGGLRDFSNFLATTLLFDSATASVSSAEPLATPRAGHTATLRTDGTVLVCGGRNETGYLASCETYDPASDAWAPAPALSIPRSNHTCTLLANGELVVTGGRNTAVLASTEVLLKDTTEWRAVADLQPARVAHDALALPWGDLLVTGGQDGTAAVPSIAVFDPIGEKWSYPGKLLTARYQHTATLLPDSAVLVAGGTSGSGMLESLERVVPDRRRVTRWSPGTPTPLPLGGHTATLLKTGKVLVAGGYFWDVGSMGFTNEAWLFDPATGQWSATGSMNSARDEAVAVLLDSGKVLVVGGTEENEADLYDPTTGEWTTTGNMVAQTDGLTATLLADGRVFVVGGIWRVDTAQQNPLRSEIYDPTTNTWAPSEPIRMPRTGHSATLLPDGQVLVIGGSDDSGRSGDTCLFEPITARWDCGTLDFLPFRPDGHTATLLQDGRVLVIDDLSRAVLDPVTGHLTLMGGQEARMQVATLLPNGQVLVTGGSDASGGVLAAAELFDPTLDVFMPAGSMGVARRSHTVTALPDGTALVIGGLEAKDSTGGTPPISATERCEFFPTAEPTLSASSYTAVLGQTLTVTGTGLRGRTEGSSGATQTSNTGYPVVSMTYPMEPQVLLRRYSTVYREREGSVLVNQTGLYTVTIDVWDGYVDLYVRARWPSSIGGGPSTTTYDCKAGFGNRCTIHMLGGQILGWLLVGEAGNVTMTMTGLVDQDVRVTAFSDTQASVVLPCQVPVGQATLNISVQGAVVHPALTLSRRGCFCGTGSACDDGDPCTANDTCDAAGGCAGRPYACTAGPCDSSSTCDGKGGCTVVRRNNGDSCDDGDPCTLSDICEVGRCVGSPNPCNTPEPGTCTSAAVSRVRNAQGVCDRQTGVCEYTYNDIGCSECGGACDAMTGVCSTDPCCGVVCNTPPVAQCYDPIGTCSGGACKYTLASYGTSCDDGDPCTANDECNRGYCVGTPSASCGAGGAGGAGGVGGTGGAGGVGGAGGAISRLDGGVGDAKDGPDAKKDGGVDAVGAGGTGGRGGMSETGGAKGGVDGGVGGASVGGVSGQDGAAGRISAGGNGGWDALGGTGGHGGAGGWAGAVGTWAGLAGASALGAVDAGRAGDGGAENRDASGDGVSRMADAGAGAARDAGLESVDSAKSSGGCSCTTMGGSDRGDRSALAWLIIGLGLAVSRRFSRRRMRRGDGSASVP